MTFVFSLLFSSAPLLASSQAEDVIIRPIADARENSPKEDLRLALFKNAPSTAMCVSLKTHPKGHTDVDTSLSRTLTEIIQAVQKKSDKDLQPLFHSRLNVSLNALSEILARMGHTYGDPLDISIYKLWALNTVDGTPQSLSCSDDRINVYAQYGYPLQFGLWLQAMGSKELGRIYISLVPVQGRWLIGGFHVQQWTHEGKDAGRWAEDGEKDKSKGLTEAAYAKYDIATKLADGGKLLELADYGVLASKRDHIQSRVDWEKSITQALKPSPVIYVATILVKGGAGILVRQSIDKEISVEDIKKNCRELTSRLMAKPWSSGLVGVRCGYNLPKEDPKTEGALGGIFIAFSELRSKEPPKN